MSVETQRGDGPVAGYAPPSDRPPLGSYAGFAALFSAGAAAALVAAGRADRLPKRVALGDVLLTGVAGHKLSRLISKDKVTSFLRAPFAEFQGSGGPAEYEEAPRGRGVRRAIGELIACPYCLGLWVVGGLQAGQLFAPRATRVVSSTFTALTISDFLQIAYKAAEDRGLGGS
jgi:Protein of unknown function (DUF1360)